MAIEDRQRYQNVFDKMPGSMWGGKDMQSSYQYAKAEFTRILCVANRSTWSAQGHLICQPMWQLLLEACISKMREIMGRNQMLRVFNHQPLVDGSRIGIFTKIPRLEATPDHSLDIACTQEVNKFSERRRISSKEHSDVIGTIFHGLDITDAYSTKLSAQRAKWSIHSQSSFRWCYRRNEPLRPRTQTAM